MAHITFQESMRKQRELRQQAIVTAIVAMDELQFKQITKPADRALALLHALQEQGYTISRMSRAHIAHIAKQHGQQ